MEYLVGRKEALLHAHIKVYYDITNVIDLINEQ